MYLKSLTLKGFKSFADPTTLDLEPGVTVVVGPNGSGKSNVVDAVAWVLGAQGPRVVRSSKMDDVIFAGTAKRPALGRAEVSLTIDNSSRRLPIDFNEVTIKRILFRSGESEYQINGVACRLLDVQELLSDTGVGRQQHVIVGQGQLDAVLVARPEDRRMVIEEAAGVLKFRRRRERSERRLEASEVALARLQDLLREVRRQLKPLERQASSAMRHEEIAAEAASLRLYLAGCELREYEARLFSVRDEAKTLETEAAGALRELESLDTALSAGQEELVEARAEALTPVVSRLGQLVERAHGVAALITERRRARAELASVLEDTDAVVALEVELSGVKGDLIATEASTERLTPQWEALGAEESALALLESAHVERFGVSEALEMNTVVSFTRAELESARHDLALAREAYARANERATALSERFDEVVSALEAIADELSSHRERRDEAMSARDQAVHAEDSLERDLADKEAALRSSETAEHEVLARIGALEGALQARSTRSQRDRLGDIPGVMGTLLELITIENDAAIGVEAALEGALDAVVVRGDASARETLERLRAIGEPASVLVLGQPRAAHGADLAMELPGTILLRRLVSSNAEGVEDLLDYLIGEVLLATGSFADAVDCGLSAPGRTIVTNTGDRFSPMGWKLRAATSGSAVVALDEARAKLDVVRQEVTGARLALDAIKAAHVKARAKTNTTTRACDEAVGDVLRNEQSEASFFLKREEFDRQALSAATERDEAMSLIEVKSAATNVLVERLGALEAEDEAQLMRSLEANTARRALEEKARALGTKRRDLEVRAAALEQRGVLLSERLADLERRLQERHEARELAAQRRGTHAVEEAALSDLARALTSLQSRVSEAIERYSGEKAQRSMLARERLERLSAIRKNREDLERRLGALRERRQRCEIDETEARVRHEAAVDRVRRDLEAIPEEAMAAQAPELPEGVDPSTRLREVERELRLLGPVNPLAREELVALTERHGFLESQLEDVRTARRELNQVIHAIDAEIVTVFAAAFADVERHFSSLIETLFPGGTGALSLTAPDDLLNTGVEIEARPAGRNVRRLSLLSGGERALVAVAFLFAVFRSRPSPFYLLDEVEASLDEVNLLRFLDLIEEFRDEAQLVIVSHQKKTMEVADALYGISMQPGGASKVVSETLSRRERLDLGPTARTERSAPGQNRSDKAAQVEVISALETS